MRISGIENYIGGADNIQALSLIQGEQRILSGQILNPDGTAIDITDFKVTAKVDFYLADVVVTARSMSISQLVQDPEPKIHTITAAKTNNTEGKFSITIPKLFYVNNLDAPLEIDTNLTTNVPIAVMYIDYNVDELLDTSSIRSSRMVFVIRRGSPSVGL